MDRKQTLQMVEELLSKARTDEAVSAIQELKDYATKLKEQVQEPLKKSADDMRKIDPKTKLPGTMLDKVDGGNTMGGSLANLTPGSTGSHVLKAAPGSTPMEANEDKWSHFKKCMGSMKKASAVDLGMSEKLTKPYASDAQRKKFHAMENRGEISHATVHEFDEASKGKKLPEHVKKAAPAPNPKDPILKQPAMQKPASPTYKDKATAFINKPPVKKASPAPAPTPTPPKAAMPKPPSTKPKPQMILKDDKPHPPGSPEDSAHDIVEEGSPLQHELKQQGTPEEIRRLFDHLRNRKKEGPGWERSPANEAVGMDKKEADPKPENMSADAKSAINASKDKPIKIATERPGQASKPTTK